MRKGLLLSLLVSVILGIFLLGQFQIFGITFQGMFAGVVSAVIVIVLGIALIAKNETISRFKKE
jgi:uncharacterized membrane protein